MEMELVSKEELMKAGRAGQLTGSTGLDGRPVQQQRTGDTEAKCALAGQ